MGDEETLTQVLDLARFTKVVDNEVEKRDSEGNISTVAGESVLWLAHRLGPVLACRFLTRNLLRMLGLCFLGVEGVRDTRRRFRDQRVRVTQFKVGGDIAAGPVLDCLAHLVGLFGDSLVVVQYLPPTAGTWSPRPRRGSAQVWREGCWVAWPCFTPASPCSLTRCS